MRALSSRDCYSPPSSCSETSQLPGRQWKQERCADLKRSVENLSSCKFTKCVLLPTFPGGYERFSGEYPFLRTQKIIYTPMVGLLPSSGLIPRCTPSFRTLRQELERLPLYPNEVVPLFLYLGDHRHAYNAAMNYDLRVHAHLNMAAELSPAYPGKIAEMRTEVKDESGTDLLARFQEIFEFLGLFGQEPIHSSLLIYPGLPTQLCFPRGKAWLQGYRNSRSHTEAPKLLLGQPINSGRATVSDVAQLWGKISQTIIETKC